MLPNFAYIRPKTLKEAMKHLSAKGALIHAGGTDLLGCLRDSVFGASTLVSLADLKELRGISETRDGGLRIGALATVTELADHPAVQRRFPGLSQAAASVASPQLRNQGTVGGNICQKPRCWYYRGEFHCLRKGGERCYAVAGENHYHCILGGDRCYIVHPSDIAPALVALDAAVKIAGPKGTRTVPVESFPVPPSVDPRRETVLTPNEIVTEISVPPAPKGLVSSYRKVQARESWDFAIAGLALAVQRDGDVVKKARVVLAAAAPVPWRSREAEQALTGKRIDATVARAAAEAAVAKARALEHNGYKIPLFRGLIEEELLANA
jgi:xanthine dehydrogenase YagS FAD-binding subunit